MPVEVSILGFFAPTLLPLLVVVNPVSSVT